MSRLESYQRVAHNRAGIFPSAFNDHSHIDFRKYQIEVHVRCQINIHITLNSYFTQLKPLSVTALLGTGVFLV